METTYSSTIQHGQRLVTIVTTGVILVILAIIICGTIDDIFSQMNPTTCTHMNKNGTTIWEQGQQPCEDLIYAP